MDVERGCVCVYREREREREREIGVDYFCHVIYRIEL